MAFKIALEHSGHLTNNSTILSSAGPSCRLPLNIVVCRLTTTPRVVIPVIGTMPQLVSAYEMVVDNKSQPNVHPYVVLTTQ